MAGVDRTSASRGKLESASGSPMTLKNRYSLLPCLMLSIIKGNVDFKTIQVCLLCLSEKQAGFPHLKSCRETGGNKIVSNTAKRYRAQATETTRWVRFAAGADDI